MSRIDVKTLVLAFENRITALDKNPPDLVPQRTISLMLENVLEEEIKNHFVYLIQKDVRKAFKNEFKKLRTRLVDDILSNLLKSDSFRIAVEDKIKKSIVNNIV